MQYYKYAVHINDTRQVETETIQHQLQKLSRRYVREKCHIKQKEQYTANHIQQQENAQAFEQYLNMEQLFFHTACKVTKTNYRLCWKRLSE